MADIGRSTTGHADGQAGTHEMLARLENWGSWQRSLPADEPGIYPASPMFRDVIDRYRETSAPSPYDLEDAEEIEALAARVLSIRQMIVLQMRFILQTSSRRAAGQLSRMGYPCSHPTYLQWVDEAVLRLTIES